MLRRLALAACLGLGAGCTSATIADDRCLVDPASINARTFTLAVGDTVTFSATLSPLRCLPMGVEPPDWRWRTDTPTVLLVDSLTGHAVALNPGITAIHVKHARYPVVTSVQTVTVLP